MTDALISINSVYPMETKLRILIVEDKPLIAENLKLTLEDLGYEVVGPCYTFVDAVNTVLKADIDLALLDINLGGKHKEENGIALGQLLAQTRQLPFIFSRPTAIWRPYAPPPVLDQAVIS